MNAGIQASGEVHVPTCARASSTEPSPSTTSKTGENKYLRLLISVVFIWTRGEQVYK